jgi:hypothetical protein
MSIALRWVMLLGLCLLLEDNLFAAEVQVAEVIQQALDAASKIQPATERERAIVLTAIVQAKAGSASGAMATLEGIHSSQRKWEALVSLSHARAHHDGTAAALLIAESIADETFRADAFAAIAEARAEEGDRSGLNEALQRALRQVAGIAKEDMRNTVLASIATVQANAGELDRASTTAQQITDDRAKADPLEVIAGIQALAGRWDEVQHTIATLQGGARQDRLLATRIVPALLQHGDVSAANDAASRIIDRGFQAIALIHVADFYIKTKSPAAANQAFERVRNIVDIIAEEKGKDLELLSIAPAQANAGDIPGARLSVAYMTRASLKYQALGFIAGALAANGNVAGAREVALSIPEGASRDHARWLIALAQAEAGDLSGAREIGGIIRDETLRANAFADLALAQGKSGDYQTAHETAASITRESSRILALMGVARVQTDAQGIPEALAWASSLHASLDRWAVLFGVSSGMLPPSARCSSWEERTFASLCR